MKTVDLIIIGAGPAGISAAITAEETGLTFALIDEQSRPGGQIYRNVEQATERRKKVLGASYCYGATLIKKLSASSKSMISEAVIWNIDNDGTVAYLKGGCSHFIHGKRILLATGALERPVPVPGWTLPGVMSAGAAQILLKQSGILPQKAIVAGSGPLIYLIATQMVRAGVPPLAIVETQRAGSYISALKYLPGALKGWKYLGQGFSMLAELKRAGVPRYTAARNLSIEGEQSAEVLAFSSKGKKVRLESSTILLHQGVVPNIQATKMLRLDHHWNDAQKCFAPSLNQWGQSSQPNIYVAGDGAGIGGVVAAEYTASIATLHIANELSKTNPEQRDRRIGPLQKLLAQELAARPFLDALYAPPEEILKPADQTIVCRCEEVTAGDIRKYAKMGCIGPNQTKAFSRAGMGPCQGRYCGLTVTQLLADANGLSPDVTGYYHIRSPLKPITLTELTSLDQKT